MNPKQSHTSTNIKLNIIELIEMLFSSIIFDFLFNAKGTIMTKHKNTLTPIRCKNSLKYIEDFQANNPDSFVKHIWLKVNLELTSEETNEFGVEKVMAQLQDASFKAFEKGLPINKIAIDYDNHATVVLGKRTMQYNLAVPLPLGKEQFYHTFTNELDLNFKYNNIMTKRCLVK